MLKRKIRQGRIGNASEERGYSCGWSSQGSLTSADKHLKEVREQVMCVPGGRALQAGRPASPEALNTFLALP